LVLPGKNIVGNAVHFSFDRKAGSNLPPETFFMIGFQIDPNTVMAFLSYSISKKNCSGRMKNYKVDGKLS
jgi:hypothetical protein